MGKAQLLAAWIKAHTPDWMLDKGASLYDGLVYGKGLKRKILAYYQDDGDLEIQAFLSRLRSKPLSVFIHEKDVPDQADIESGFDAECKLYYCVHHGKRVYFPRTQANGTKAAKRLYRYLCYEQQLQSPHRYFLTPAEEYAKDQTVVEIGAAEGLFSLDCVDAAKRVYIFETEPDWVCALQKTFAPYQNKVTIVQKYVSNVTDDQQIRLDDYFPTQDINVLKMDVEGAELMALEGAQALIRRSLQLQMAIAVYHRAEHEKQIKALLASYNPAFFFETSQGYLCFYYDPEFAPPYLRRGVLRCFSGAGVNGKASESEAKEGRDAYDRQGA